MQCRWFVAVALLAASAGAQAPTGMIAGGKVRIVVLDSTPAGLELVNVNGRFDATTVDTLLIKVGRGGMSRVPIARVRSIAVVSGRRHPYVKAAVIGSIVGFALGRIAYAADPHKDQCTPASTPAVCAAAVPTLNGTKGMAIGLAIGLGVAAVGRERWVPLASLP